MALTPGHPRARAVGRFAGRRCAGARMPFEAPAPARASGRRRRDRRAARARLAGARRLLGAPGLLRGARRAGSCSSSSRSAGRCAWTAPTRRRAWRRRASCAPSDGRWLAGRRASWLATWPGRWALGAGGVDRAPARTRRTRSARELREEWSVVAERITVEALVCLPAPARHADRARLARARAPRSRPTRSTTPSRGGPRRSTVAAEADEPLRAIATMLSARAVITFNALRAPCRSSTRWSTRRC